MFRELFSFFINTLTSPTPSCKAYLKSAKNTIKLGFLPGEKNPLGVKVLMDSHVLSHHL